MADQGRWFKLWVSSPDDPDLDNLAIADYGRWAKFGAYLKEHGTDGTVTLSAPCRTLQSKFQLGTFEAVIDCIKMFPNCSVTLDTNATVTCRVEWKNWAKYQGDFSGDRVRRHREKKRDHVTAKKRREEKRIRREKEPPLSSPILPSLTPSNNGSDWGTPESLVALYNEATPGECPSVEWLSPARRDKARRYLSIFPDQAFWTQAFREIHASRFLRGLIKRDGHASFVADFDWLLTKGKDGTENVVKVSEGKYREDS